MSRKDMEKILTIVIPTYNMERYLDNTLSSLVLADKELLKQIEVLVVNDGSKDSSSEIGHVFEERYPDTFCVIDKENGNYGSCINRGLKEAQGKYIKVLDADDSYDTFVFEEFVNFIKDKDVDCIFSDFCRVDDFGNSKGIVTYPLPTEREFSLNALPKYMNLWIHAVCYRTANLRRIKYSQLEGLSYTDQEWIYLPMTTIKRAIYFKKVLYKYLVGRDGQTMDPKTYAKNMPQTIIIFEKMMRQYEEVYDLSSQEVKDFLDDRMRRRVSVIYRAFLFRYPQWLDQQQLIDLDKKMKKVHPRIYQLTNDVDEYAPQIGRLTYKYVKDWRRNYSQNTLIRRIFEQYAKISTAFC